MNTGLLARKQNLFLTGAVGGIVGTAAYTASGVLVSRGRFAAGDARPVDVAVVLSGDHNISALPNELLHWGYGLSGGLSRSLLIAAGFTGWRLNAAHLAMVWLPWRALVWVSGQGGWRGVLPTLTDGVRHLIYVLADGAAVRLLRSAGVRW